ncbi:MAG: CDP-archaeol synthase [Lachnospiraceae bacterium]|nr:CDP-archaeol synthase [Lachnospiraceae bacterium]
MIILKMYITMFPVIIAGILNMMFVKTPMYKHVNRPIDGGGTLRDGKRVFGENKTWAGFFGMIVFGAAAQVLWGLVCTGFPELCRIYSRFGNTPLFNLAAGAAMGFVYVLFELPNSFVKRRLDIPSGKTARGLKGAVFFVIDQVDSLFGVAGVFAVLFPMTVWEYFAYILLGAGTHIAVNSILYATRIRKNL